MWLKENWFKLAAVTSLPVTAGILVYGFAIYPEETRVQKTTEEVKEVFLSEEIMEDGEEKKPQPETVTAEESQISEEKIISQNVSEQHGEEIEISVKAISFNTFGEISGSGQYPASVAYHFSNPSDEDVSITELYFILDKHGDHLIDANSTLYSISEEQGDKTDPYYVTNERGIIDHILDTPFIIPAKGTSVVYLNVWNFGGIVLRKHPSKEKETIFVLKEVSSGDNNVVFNLGLNQEIVTNIPHDIQY